jgi:hypothetical protein
MLRLFRLSSIGLAAIFVIGLCLPVSAHDQYRFVGTVVKWDRTKQKLEMKARETQEDGQIKEYTVRMSVPDDATVTRASKKVSRSELKPGVFVVVDAVGVDMVEIDATEITIIPQEAPKTSKR